MTNRKLNLSKVFRKLKFGKDLDLRVSPPRGVGGWSARFTDLSILTHFLSGFKPYAQINPVARIRPHSRLPPCL